MVTLKLEDRTVRVTVYYKSAKPNFTEDMLLSKAMQLTENNDPNIARIMIQFLGAIDLI